MALLPIWLARGGIPVGHRPYELNLVGFRADSTKPNTFNDKMKVFWYDKLGIYHQKTYQITTDPGTYWLLEPMNSSGGTAMVAAGHYKNCWSLGYHKGKYRALVQTGDIDVFRDYNRNNVLDFLNGTKIRGKYGINCHRASATTRTLKVDKYSAGCQVFADPKEFDEFIDLCERHAELYGNHFSYTLVDERMYMRTMTRRLGYFAAFAAVGYGVSKLIKA